MTYSKDDLGRLKYLVNDLITDKISKEATEKRNLLEACMSDMEEQDENYQFCYADCNDLTTLVSDIGDAKVCEYTMTVLRDLGHHINTAFNELLNEKEKTDA